MEMQQNQVEETCIEDHQESEEKKDGVEEMDTKGIIPFYFSSFR